MKGARNMCYCDVFDNRLFTLNLVAQSVFSQMHVITHDNSSGITYLRKDYESEFREILSTEPNKKVAHGKALGYGYTGEDFAELKNRIVTSFDISDEKGEDIGQLYGYCCPGEKYTEDMDKKNLEKLRAFNRILMPVGYAIFCNKTKL
jgi:hypothetical protein